MDNLKIREVFCSESVVKIFLSIFLSISILTGFSILLAELFIHSFSFKIEILNYTNFDIYIYFKPFVKLFSILLSLIIVFRFIKLNSLILNFLILTFISSLPILIFELVFNIEFGITVVIIEIIPVLLLFISAIVLFQSSKLIEKSISNSFMVYLISVSFLELIIYHIGFNELEFIDIVYFLLGTLIVLFFASVIARFFEFLLKKFFRVFNILV